MIRLVVVAVALVSSTLPLMARGPIPPLPNSRSLPMHFDWRQEGPADTCGKGCRTWISAVGAITADTPREFDDFTKGRDARGATIVLDSEGGSTLGALSLGRSIRSLNMTTTVGRTTELMSTDGANPRASLSPRADCESMCTFVLLAGVKRSVPPEARVLVHEIWLGDRRSDATAATYSAEDLVLVQRDIGRLALYTVEMGGDIALLDTALRIPPWEPMRLLTPDELRRMRLNTVDNPFDAATAVVATNSGPAATTVSLRPSGITERGWALIDKPGLKALARRHPLTREGEDIGRFDVMISCADSADVYNVTYVERRRGSEQRAPEPLTDVTIMMGPKSAALKVASSQMGNRTAEVSSVARGVIPAAQMQAFADANDRSMTVIASSGAEQQTTIRVGNTGVADGFPQLASSCSKKTASAN